MPTAHALQVKSEVLVGDERSQTLLQLGAIVAVARGRHEIVHDGLRMRSADHGVDARELTKAQVACRHFARDAADARARAETVADIELARGLSDLKPDIAGECFVGALAGEDGLVAFARHVAAMR